MATETQIHICEKCQNNIENDYERHIWHETCRLNGIYKSNFCIYIDDNKFEKHLQNLERNGYIKYRNIKPQKVVVKSNCSHHFKDKILYCISPKEHSIDE